MKKSLHIANTWRKWRSMKTFQNNSHPLETARLWNLLNVRWVVPKQSIPLGKSLFKKMCRYYHVISLISCYPLTVASYPPLKNAMPRATPIMRTRLSYHGNMVRVTMKRKRRFLGGLVYFIWHNELTNMISVSDLWQQWLCGRLWRLPRALAWPQPSHLLWLDCPHDWEDERGQMQDKMRPDIWESFPPTLPQSEQWQTTQFPLFASVKGK